MLLKGETFSPLTSSLFIVQHGDGPLYGLGLRVGSRRESRGWGICLKGDCDVRGRRY